LALETTELAGGVAAAIDGKALQCIRLDPRQRSAQSLAPAVKAVLEKTQWRPADVQLVAVTRGPGSFTGLRVGVATAKIFAYAVGAEVLGVDTLEVIAAAAPAEVEAVSAAVDAQRGDVVAATFRRNREGRLEPAGPARLTPIDDWLSALPPGMIVTGPVLKKLAGPLPPGIENLDPALWAPTAENVARVAFQHYQAGRRDDLWQLVPIYSRRSAAEEKAEKKNER
jgi:tRNA threonylcarbamoyladenosine biosynthesis protein TsaB